jgi:hypothetical protein
MPNTIKAIQIRKKIIAFIAEPLVVVRVAILGTLVLVWQSKELPLLLVGKANYS